MTRRRSPHLPERPVAPAGGGLGFGYALIEPDVAASREYELHEDVVRLKHWTDFGFLAANHDLKASQPPGWVIHNAAAASSCTGNVGGTGALQAVAAGAGNWWAGTHSGFALLRNVKDGWRAGDEMIFRAAIAFGAVVTNEEAVQVGFVQADMSAPTTFPTNNGMYWDLGFTNSLQKIRAKNDGDQTSVNTSQAINGAGVWLRLRHEGQLTSWWYDLTDSATPPHRAGRDWTVVNRTNVAAPPHPGAPLQWGMIVQAHNNAAADFTSKVTYLEFLSRDPADSPSVNCGTSTGSPELKLLADLDIGASATLTDAALRAALAAAENTRRYDTATWTYSAVRSASLGAGSGSYAAAGAVSVSGTGRYLNLWAKANSNGGQAGSFRRDFRVRVAA